MKRGSNPYASPVSGSNSLEREHRFHIPCWLRLSGALLLMIGVNLIPLYLSWDAPKLDGRRRIGWPLNLAERNGIQCVGALLVNCIVALAVSYGAARSLDARGRNAISRFLRIMRNGG